jgi:hypothetical protein
VPVSSELHEEFCSTRSRSAAFEALPVWRGTDKRFVDSPLLSLARELRSDSKSRTRRKLSPRRSRNARSLSRRFNRRGRCNPQMFSWEAIGAAPVAVISGGASGGEAAVSVDTTRVSLIRVDINIAVNSRAAAR